jgi:hypothetical protein
VSVCAVLSPPLWGVVPSWTLLLDDFAVCVERRRHTSLSTAQSSWRGQHSSTRFLWHDVTMGEIDAGHRGSRLAGRSKCAVG